MNAVDSRCVFETSDPDLAHIVAARLASEGVQSQVLDRRTEGNLFGASLMSGSGGHAGGMLVCIQDVSQRALAESILAEHQRPAPATAAPVVATCSQCGKATEFPGEQRGTVQECSHCGEYIDVPDPGREDDFADEDFGEDPSEL